MTLDLSDQLQELENRFRSKYLDPGHKLVQKDVLKVFLKNIATMRSELVSFKPETSNDATKKTQSQSQDEMS